MASLTWGPNLKIGFGDIDAQHRRLVELVNRLEQGFEEGDDNDVLADVLNDLVRYTKLHFAFEEKLMAQYGLDESDEHHQQHANLTQDVINYVERFQAGEPGLEVELLQFLSAWLRGHILGSDRELAAQLIAAGAESAT